MTFLKILLSIPALWIFYAQALQAIDLDGTLAQGGLAWGRVAPGATVWLDNKPVYVGPDGHFVIGFGRDYTGNAKLSITHPDRQKMESHTLPVAQREFDIERVNGLPPKTVSPPPEWTARRATETGRVRQARKAVTSDLYWLEGFNRPAEGRFSGFYGSQRILNGKPRSPHYGLDIAAPVGTPVYAPAGGTITLAAPDFLLEGGIVVIDHGFGLSSTMFHMNSVDVKEGQTVQRGDPVGTIGAKGRASGPHVDWRINWGKVRLDPALVIGLMR